MLVLAAGGLGLAAEPGGGVMAVTWPSSLGAWQRLGEPRRVDPAGIFEYMDGAGELYLAYRFDHLEVAEYGAAGEDQVLAEVYLMGSGDDAYGLLSQDWGGEPVVLGEGGCRGLYGAGLLRASCGTRFVRVLATRETAASREVDAAHRRGAARRPAARPRRRRSSPHCPPPSPAARSAPEARCSSAPTSCSTRSTT